MNDASSRPSPPYPEQQQTPSGYTSGVRPVPDHGERSYRGNGKLDGKVALITGADSGIGKALQLLSPVRGPTFLFHISAKTPMPSDGSRTPEKGPWRSPETSHWKSIAKIWSSMA